MRCSRGDGGRAVRQQKKQLRRASTRAYQRRMNGRGTESALKVPDISLTRGPLGPSLVPFLRLRGKGSNLHYLIQSQASYH